MSVRGAFFAMKQSQLDKMIYEEEIASQNTLATLAPAQFAKQIEVQV
jgi:hypothetical protein